MFIPRTYNRSDFISENNSNYIEAVAKANLVRFEIKRTLKKHLPYGCICIGVTRVIMA